MFYLLWLQQYHHYFYGKKGIKYFYQLVIKMKLGKAKRENGNSSSNSFNLQLYGGCSNGNHIQEEVKGMEKEYRIPENIKPQDLVRGIINASFWHWHTIDKIQHTEAIEYLNNIEESLEIWIDLLSKDGVNSKAQVRLQMQAVLYGLKNKQVKE